jgi:two-component system response regulator AtoC/two-component system nitrogen regulation response regulator NtrX
MVKYRERRRNPRVALELGVDFIDSSKEIIPLDANISSSGMFFYTSVKPPDLGTVIALAIRRFQYDNVLYLKGKIVRVIESQAKGKWGVAVTFVEVPPRERMRLLDLINSVRGNQPVVHVNIEDLYAREMAMSILADEHYKVFDMEDLDSSKILDPDILVIEIDPQNANVLEMLEDIKEMLVVVIVKGPKELREKYKIKNSNWEFISSPVAAEHLIRAVSRLLRASLITKREALPHWSSMSEGMGLVTKSDKMLKLLDIMAEAVIAETPVLITGETGVGKDRVANELHRMSFRSEGPFVRVDCANLNKNLATSDFCGHKVGSFTDAKQERQGYFERADNGILFLDEIGDLSPENQTILLRFLDRKTFEKVGGQEVKESNAWVISATNRDIRQMVIERKFREDLYYRLHVHHLIVPPLRRRMEDIELIAHDLINEINEQHKKSIENMGERARKQLLVHDWPGNIRELRNVLETSIISTKGNVLNELKIKDVSSERHMSKVLERNNFVIDINKPWKEIRNEMVLLLEKDYFSRTLINAKGNISHAAKAAGISRQKFADKLKKLNINSYSDEE